uniref:Uncharacterized protein n=1 Tax=Arundo donax TaxID=35708 RepID=A0A0A9E7I8_ARUDO
MGRETQWGWLVFAAGPHVVMSHCHCVVAGARSSSIQPQKLTKPWPPWLRAQVTAAGPEHRGISRRSWSRMTPADLRGLRAITGVLHLASPEQAPHNAPRWSPSTEQAPHNAPTWSRARAGERAHEGAAVAVAGGERERRLGQ